MKHVEMIIDYVVDGEDFQYSDNHGVLIRCKDCKDWYPFSDHKLFGFCRRKYREYDGQYRLQVETNHEDYCSYGERRDV